MTENLDPVDDDRRDGPVVDDDHGADGPEGGERAVEPVRVVEHRDDHGRRPRPAGPPGGRHRVGDRGVDQPARQRPRPGSRTGRARPQPGGRRPAPRRRTAAAPATASPRPRPAPHRPAEQTGRRSAATQQETGESAPPSAGRSYSRPRPSAARRWRGALRAPGPRSCRTLVQAVKPASTGSTAPVTPPLVGPQTQATRAATSSGSSSRPSRWCCGEPLDRLEVVDRGAGLEHRRACRPGGDGVGRDPEGTELGGEAADEAVHAVLGGDVGGEQRQPVGAAGRRDGDEPAVARFGAGEQRRARRPGTSRQTPSRLTPISVVHMSSPVSHARAPPAMHPAAATAASSPPKRSTAAATAASSAAWSRTSASIPRARSPPPQSATTPARSSASPARRAATDRACTDRRGRGSTRRRPAPGHMAAPMPRPAPVMMATGIPPTSARRGRGRTRRARGCHPA